ncbi:hypothetical protein HG536_0H04940 [Torulaspora globosa]|uniref:D-lactate dehydratase n=1 Tax=Torulaspora globosa TaxID=48254 RepID=A0A7G3ZNN2_9SACH|nr:uncharacterized protein HG536_0H04940 [Torulaspora globosa]QLL35118.1 hypothetical protein HG536_0H04940 [Torulaspora globosa]
MVKALIAITSYNEVFYQDGARAGVFVVEALHPYEVLREKGVEVDFVSETGKFFGWDEHSLSTDFLKAKDREIIEKSESSFMKAIRNVKKPSELNVKDYQIFFASGGHGASYDFPRSPHLQKLVADVSANGGVIGAVCHGPAIFDNLKTLEGNIFIKGKKLTGFTDEGEEILNLAQIMKDKGMKTIKQVADTNGATYVQPADPWGSFVVVDGKLVTGVNPASAAETAAKTVETLKH